jgi:hypothetical protein
MTAIAPGEAVTQFNDGVAAGAYDPAAATNLSNSVDVGTTATAPEKPDQDRHTRCDCDGFIRIFMDCLVGGFGPGHGLVADAHGDPPAVFNRLTEPVPGFGGLFTGDVCGRIQQFASLIGKRCFMAFGGLVILVTLAMMGGRTHNSLVVVVDC